MFNHTGIMIAKCCVTYKLDGGKLIPCGKDAKVYILGDPMCEYHAERLKDLQQVTPEELQKQLEDEESE